MFLLYEIIGKKPSDFLENAQMVGFVLLILLFMETIFTKQL
jgi:hypothetical protein